MESIMDYSLYELMDMPDPNIAIKIARFQPEIMGTVFRNHWHEHMELLFIMKGTLSVKCSQNSFFAKEGDLVIFNSNELHWGEKASAELDLYCIIFNISLLMGHYIDGSQKRYISPIAQNTILFQNLIQNDKTISDCTLQIVREYEQKDFAYELSPVQNRICSGISKG
jgi:mannose-6-phosphate isomerase-like protein (cupin superfamily)